MIGFAGFLRDDTVLRCWDHALLDGILVGMKHPLFPVHQGDIGPERLSALVAAIPHVKGNDLTGRRIHRNPHPLFVRLLLHEAPHRIGFRFQARQQYGGGMCGERHMEVMRAGGEALDHKVYEPGETDAHRTADPAQREAFAQQLLDLSALGGAMRRSIA